MPDQVDIKVSEDLIRGIIETKVQTAITEAMSSERGVVEQVVAAALTTKVDADGKRSRYSSDNKFTYLDHLCKKIIRQAAESAIARWAEERQEQLEAEFLRQLKTKRTSSLLVKACVNGLSEAVSSNWKFKIEINER